MGVAAPPLAGGVGEGTYLPEEQTFCYSQALAGKPPVAHAESHCLPLGIKAPPTLHARGGQ
jgi:hypothetical protein